MFFSSEALARFNQRPAMEERNGRENMMSNPSRLISLLALILLFNLTAPAQQQPADSQANQNPQQPADKNSSQTPQQSQEDQTSQIRISSNLRRRTQPRPSRSLKTDKVQADQKKKDQQQAAEDKKQIAEDKAGANPQEPEGLEGLGYVIHQTIETGYRVSDVNGSQQMYNTLINLPQGPRLLEQSLSMQSPKHQGLLFDNLFVNSFGWGGDPYNAFNARADKSNLYDFRMTYRNGQQ